MPSTESRKEVPSDWRCDIWEALLALLLRKKRVRKTDGQSMRPGLPQSQAPSLWRFIFVG